jgi:Xaa-Pro aminopeptidase
MTMRERLQTPMSDGELERRWSAVRGIMAERQIDALVMQSNNDWLGGTVKWFTDGPAVNGYPRSVVFHAGDLMTVVEMGPRGGRRRLDGADPVHRGVGEILTTAAFTSVAYTEGYQAELVLEDLTRRAYRRIGLIGPGAMPHGFVCRLHDALAGKAEIVDASEPIDRLKAVKSAEEINLIRQAAAMQDQVFTRVAAQLRPGMCDNEVTALAQYEGRRLGSEQGLFLGSSAPPGQRADFLDRHQQGRRLAPGDHFSLLIENNGPGGCYTEIARTMVLGKATNEIIDGFETVKAAQAHTLRLLKPGASCRDIAAAHDDFMRARGLPPELRLYCHGQGYDLVERPLVRGDETMPIAESMNLAVHPAYETGSLFAVICDNYLIGPDGPGECLHKTPKQIFELD